MSKISETLTKRYYTIGEMAKMFEVSKSLVRFWEQEFDVLKPHKNSKGERRFTPQNVQQFELIYHLVKEKGFTLNGAKLEIQHRKERQRKQVETMARLKSLKIFLLNLKDQMKE